jgi:TRAP-type C4-dicarboxylate transport system substrate-binding protein
MNVARRRFVTLAAAAFATPALVRLARAQAQVTLKLHHFFSPLSSMHDKFLVPWAKQVGVASDGRIRVDVFAAMQLGGTPSDLYDQARDGIADIVWTLPGISPSRFPTIEAVELPFVAGRRALANARAVQAFSEGSLRDEFRAVLPLCVVAHDQGLLHTAKPIATLDDLKDLKLRPPTRLAGEALKALGANAAFVPLSQVADMFGRKLLDGCVLPWDTAAAAKVHELMKFHAAIATSPTLSTGAYILVMNRAKYGAMPPELRKVIDDASGDAAATMVGRMWDEQAAGIEEMVRKRGNMVSAIGSEEAERWRKATEPVIEGWIKQARARSIDGPKVIETVRALVAKYEAQLPAVTPAPVAAAEPAQVPAPAVQAPAASTPAPTCATWCPSP